MRVLVTGHNGYIGSVMAPALLRARHDIVGLDAYLYEQCTHGPATKDVPSIRRDLREVDQEDLSDFDAVIHLAALSNDPLGDLEPEHTHAINHVASVRLAELAKRAGVSRFLYSSSCSIYGAAAVDRPLDETAPFKPVTPYAESKVRVEGDLSALADDRFSPVSLRNATAYGWSPRLRCDLVLNDLVARAYLDGEVRVLSDGTPWRPLVHVEDISQAFLAALEAPRDAVHDAAFNVGRDEDNHQVRDLAEIVADAVGGCPVVIAGETGPDTRSYRVDFRKIRSTLPAFRPRWTARSGAQELLGAYRHHGLSAEAFTGVYKRLPWLSRLREEGIIDATLRRVPATLPASAASKG